MYDDLPQLGVGLGYRMPLHDQILANADRIDFLEFISDQYLHTAPERTERLVDLLDTFPLIPHGTGMSIGTAGALDADYLARLGALTERVDAPWFSDHLSFSRVPDTDVEQLTPLWFTQESLEAVHRNVRQVRGVIDRPFLLENITYYFAIPGNEMTEAQFTSRVLEETDIGLLLDVNNVSINSINLGFDPYEFLDSVPLERTVQIHIAGGTETPGMIVDTHSTPVTERVWDLLGYVLDRAPVKAILLEWDQDWPEFEVLMAHLDRARDMLRASRVAGAST